MQHNKRNPAGGSLLSNNCAQGPRFIVGIQSQVLPDGSASGAKEKGPLLKEVGDAAKALIPQLKLVKTVSELMPACREVLIKIKARWPRIILTESFQQASMVSKWTRCSRNSTTRTSSSNRHLTPSLNIFNATNRRTWT